MNEYIIELENDNFDIIHCDCLAEAEAIAYERYGFDYLEIHREK